LSFNDLVAPEKEKKKTQMRNKKKRRWKVREKREGEGPFECVKEMIWQSLEGKASCLEGSGGGGRPV